METQSLPHEQQQTAQEYEPRLADNLEDARRDLDIARAARSYLEDRGSDPDVLKTIDTDIAAKSDWVDYLTQRPFEDSNGQLRDSKGRFASRTKSSAEKHMQETLDSEYKDRTYNELIDLLIDADKHGDRTIFEDAKEAINEKIAADSKRDNLTEKQTDNLFDELIMRIIDKRDEVEEEAANDDNQEAGDSEAVEEENEEADETEPEKKGKIRKWFRKKLPLEKAAYLIKHPEAIVTLGLTKLFQAPGKIMQRLEKAYKKEDGEFDRKKFIKHAVIGVAIVGSAVVIVKIAKSTGVEASGLHSAINHASSNVPGPHVATPDVSQHVTLGKPQAPHFADVVPKNPALTETLNHVTVHSGEGFTNVVQDVLRDNGFTNVTKRELYEIYRANAPQLAKEIPHYVMKNGDFGISRAGDFNVSGQLINNIIESFKHLKG